MRHTNLIHLAIGCASFQVSPLWNTLVVEHVIAKKNPLIDCINIDIVSLNFDVLRNNFIRQKTFL